MKNFTITFALLIAMLPAFRAHSQSTPADDDAAWKDVRQAAIMPNQPQSWRTQQPTREEFEAYIKQVAAVATAAVQKAKAFYTQFPDNTNAIAARKLECSMLKMMYNQGGQTQSNFDALVSAQRALLQAPNLSKKDRMDALVDLAADKRFDPKLDWKARNAEYEKALEQLIKAYPQEDKPYEMLVILGAESADDQARSIANEILAAAVSDSIKDKANAILNRLNAVGKPLDFKFTALDGREVDLSQMKGKVVLVDFWATWCGPCVGEIPHVKEAYDNLHSKGFEVVGISFDSDKSRLQNFVQSHDMPWPQYFDGQQWGNKFGNQYAIDSIPTMWLVDKNGNLRDSNARNDLQGKVEKLLAE